MRVVDETEADIRALIARDFGPTTPRAFHDDFIDWLHFKARAIPTLPRTVITSPEVVGRLGEYPAIINIRMTLKAGLDVSPWLSKTVRTAKTNAKVDMLFNDWQIMHFHLGQVMQTPRMVGRTKPLLFAHIAGSEATLIDVEPHGAWTELTLLQKLLRANPNAMPQFNMVTPNALTSQQLKNLRANRTNALIDVDGKAIMPGGIMSSGHAMRILNYYQWFQRQAEFLKKQFEADQVPAHLRPVIYARLGTPIRLGTWYDAGGLSLIDKNRNGLVLHQMRPLE